MRNEPDVLPRLGQICAVITTYSPNSSIIDCVKAILPQVGGVVIVDDGASEDNVEKLAEWFRNVPAITIWHQPANSGIAAALNAGIKIAQKRGYQWVLTLDDDSLPDLDMVERLCKCLYLIESEHSIGLIGMRWTSPHQASNRYKSTSIMPECLDKRGIITSGSLFSVRTYEIVGPFREEFFIDAVDYDFCMRARAKGFRIIQVQEFGFVHSLGETHNYRFACFTFSAYCHPPERLYYFFRNATILAREHFLRDPLFGCAVIATHLKTLVKVLLLQREKRKKCIAMMKGLMDAVSHNTGRKNLFLPANNN